jgi:uncharacterized protein (TIGR03435 family)
MTKLSCSKYVSAGTAGVLAAVLPGAFGLLMTVRVEAQLPPPAVSPAPSFEVASIRPSQETGALTNYQLSNTLFHAESAPLTALIRLAYDIKSDDQLPREPGWIASEKFNIDARIDSAEAEAMSKMPPDKKFARVELMIRSLLEDRFRLRVSTQSKELSVFALVVAKGGPKIATSNVPPGFADHRTPTLAGGSRGDMKAVSVSMSLFAQWLSGSDDTGGRVVIDATGLTGAYDFALNWLPEHLRRAQLSGSGAGQVPTGVASTEVPGISLFTALQEQLGLKLESRKAPVAVLAIDHVERPSPN